MSTHICDLPNDITSLIFKGIPLSSIIQCRPVCKEWNSLILAPEFSPLNSPQFQKPNSQKPMLVENDHMEGCSIRVYSSQSHTWVPISLPFLVDPSQRRPLYLTASSGGLMCFETDDRKSFIICNPVTKKWRHLQLPVIEDDYSVRTVCSCLNPTFCIHWQQNMPDTLTGLVVDRKSGSYKLIIASLAEGRERRRTFIYDSLQGSWTIGAQVPEGKGFVNPVALSVKGNLYCIMQGLDHKMVAKYDAKHDTWCCSAPLVSEVSYSCPEKRDLELIEHDAGVKLISRRVNRHAGYGAFYSVGEIYNWDNSVLSVDETCGGVEVQANQMDLKPHHSDLVIISRLQTSWIVVQESASSETVDDRNAWKALASAYSASYVGHDQIIYTLCRLQTPSQCNEPSMFHVLKIRCDTCYVAEVATLLPSFRMEDSSTNTQVELRLFEPSLTAQV